MSWPMSFRSGTNSRSAAMIAPRGRPGESSRSGTGRSRSRVRSRTCSLLARGSARRRVLRRKELGIICRRIAAGPGDIALRAEATELLGRWSGQWGFEPTTSCSQSTCATTALHPGRFRARGNACASPSDALKPSLHRSITRRVGSACGRSRGLGEDERPRGTGHASGRSGRLVLTRVGRAPASRELLHLAVVHRHGTPGRTRSALHRPRTPNT